MVVTAQSVGASAIIPTRTRLSVSGLVSEGARTNPTSGPTVIHKPLSTKSASHQPQAQAGRVQARKKAIRRERLVGVAAMVVALAWLLRFAAPVVPCVFLLLLGAAELTQARTKSQKIKRAQRRHRH